MTKLKRRPRSARLYLASVAAALTLPFFIVACVATMHFADSEAAFLERSAKENCADLLARLDADIAGRITFLQTLASSPALDRGGDIARFDEQARTFNEPDVAILLIEASTGRQIVNTRLSRGAPMYALTTLTAAAVRAFGESRPVVSSLFEGANTGEPIVEIVVPVIRNGAVDYLLSAVIRPPVFARLIAGLGLAAPYYGVIADSDGAILARSVPGEQHVGRRLPGLNTRTVFRGKNIQGVPILGFSRRLDVSGWHVGTSVELEALNAPLSHSLAKLALLALALCMAATLVVIVATRRLRRSHAALVQATDALARGEPVVAPHTMIAEADAIGRALAAASDNLRMQASALSAANEKLEHRVAERTKALEAARDRAEAGAIAKSEFLANMSHELRTPLTAIVGASDLLLSGYAVGHPDRQKRYLEMQREAGNNLLALINDILDFSKIEAGQVHIEQIVFSLRQTAESALNLVRDQANRKETSLELICDASMPDLVLGDPTRVGQVLINLLSNAVKFTGKGNVRVRCAGTPGGHGVYISVQDSGIGIPAEKLAGLFDRFTQADTSTTRRYGGSGLGLSITKRLIDLMGGTIAVESAVGRGSIFTVVLPLAEVVTAPVPANANDETRRPLRRILLAEDNVVNRDIVATMLREKGHEVVEVSNGRAAVTAVNTAAAFDIILMDIQMPEVDGYEATRVLREHECRVPIIALTANALSDEPARCLAAGMDLHIPKPVDWARLFDAIDTLVDPTAAAA